MSARATRDGGPGPVYVDGMEVQVFGIKGDADTRKALRFFKERRVKVHFMDFKQRSPAPGELRRFFERFGEENLIDRSAKRFQALGLGAAYYGTDRWLGIACEEPLILRMPLARSGSHLSVGLDEAAWTEWLSD
jgi:arsenate reductase